MNKSLIKSQVKQAYYMAKQYPDFLQQFKYEIQNVIDQHVPKDVTKLWHINADINTLSKRSKQNGYKTSQFLSLVAGYIIMIVQAVENHNREPFKHINQRDIFDEIELQNPEDN